MQHHEAHQSTSRRARGDDGVAVVEFAFVSVLLFMLIFGIIHFGLLLSFNQDITRAAAEGARAGAVAFPADDAYADALAETQRAVEGFDRDCNTNDGMDCYVNVHDCVAPPARETPSGTFTSGNCVTVELVYDHANHPLLAQIPIISGFMPDTLRASSVARTNAD